MDKKLRTIICNTIAGISIPTIGCLIAAAGVSFDIAFIIAILPVPGHTSKTFLVPMIICSGLMQILIACVFIRSWYRALDVVDHYACFCTMSIDDLQMYVEHLNLFDTVFVIPFQPNGQTHPNPFEQPPRQILMILQEIYDCMKLEAKIVGKILRYRKKHPSS